jgi:membrane dipeptidase
LENVGAVADQAQRLHEQSTVVVVHDHTMFSLAARRSRGERAVFSIYCAPRIRRGGVDVLGLVVGGDIPLLGIEPLDPWWGSLAALDMLWQEAEESSDTLKICLSCQDIDVAVATGRIAALVTMEGGLPVGERSNEGSLVNLRTLYRLGLRSLQFLGQSWNRLTDAAGEDRRSKGLTRFGVDVVREMNRLGMVIDMAHVPDPDPLFWDVMETSRDPIIDSHRCVRGANDIPRNISDERIKAIAETGGLIGIQFFSSTLASETADRATVADVVRHIDHVVEVAGVDYVGLGPDFLESELMDRGPGFYAEGIDDITKLPLVTEALVARGYSDEDVRKILGENILRVYRRVVG